MQILSFNCSFERQGSGQFGRPGIWRPNLSQYSSSCDALSQNDQHHFENNSMPRRSILTERPRSALFDLPT